MDVNEDNATRDESIYGVLNEAADRMISNGLAPQGALLYRQGSPRGIMDAVLDKGEDTSCSPFGSIMLTWWIREDGKEPSGKTRHDAYRAFMPIVQPIADHLEEVFPEGHKAPWRFIDDWLAGRSAAEVAEIFRTAAEQFRGTDGRTE